MNERESRYLERGVSSSKTEVQAAVEKLNPGLFPGAFCKVLPDYLGGSEHYCNIQHADGAGTKAALAYLSWKHSGNLKVWKGIAEDSLVMNLDDVGCVGGLGPFLVSLTIGRNKKLIPGEVIKTLIEGCDEFCQFLTDLHIPCHFSGGETADIGDLVRTITVDNTLTLRLKRDEIISARKIEPGGLIVGFSSTGQATWESELNSGIGANGLTNARHDLLEVKYRNDTETYSPETNPDLIYCGDYSLDRQLPGDPSFTIGSALLSPTRTYLPLIYRLIHDIGIKHLQALIHCSGGGQTKIGKFGKPEIMYIKDSLFPVPPLFQLLKYARNLSWPEMYSVYNMGHRLEVVVQGEKIADECIALARDCSIEAKVVGAVVQKDSNVPEGRRVVIKTKKDEISYYT